MTESTLYDSISSTNSADADLIVIGGGGAGFAAAIRGHEFGAKVIMVNAGVIGGTCVNVGCVPSKTLIRAAEAGHRSAHIRFAGIESSSRVSDFGAIIRQKDELVGSLRQAKYVDVLAAYENIRLVEGRALFTAKDAITVGHTIRAPHIVVSTGSRPWIPPIPGLREAEPLSSTTAFELDRLPESVIVLGGRYIALECAQMLARLGSRVTILQRSDHLLPDEDADLTTALVGYLREEGITVETSVGIERVSREQGHSIVYARVAGKKRTFHGERILCATGRRPITETMGLEDVGIDLGGGGHIEVDDYLQTSVAGVFAAGDVIGEPAFVYTAVMFPQIGGHGKEQIIYALFLEVPPWSKKRASTPRSSRGKRWNCWKTAAGPFMPFPENLGYRSELSMIGSKRRGRRRQSLVPAAPKRPRFCDSAESWRW